MQEIASCESDATKKEVQATNTQKQSDKLRKDLEKSKREEANLVEQQKKTMEVEDFVHSYKQCGFRLATRKVVRHANYKLHFFSVQAFNIYLICCRNSNN